LPSVAFRSPTVFTSKNTERVVIHRFSATRLRLVMSHP
jgi:hypothetical protein